MERDRTSAFREWLLPEDRRRALAAMAILIPVGLGFFLVDLARFGGSADLLPWLIARAVLIVGYFSIVMAARATTGRWERLYRTAAVVVLYAALYSSVRHFISTSSDLAHHATDTFFVILIYFTPTYLWVQAVVGISVSGSALWGLARVASEATAGPSMALIAAHISANAAGFVIATHLTRAARLRFQTEEEVRELREILPMCARCKSVRDDTGFWQRVESYLASKAEVGVSHGLCPTCMEDLYGKEVADRVAAKLRPGDEETG